jgi:Phosphotransferase enzyme family
MIVSSGTPSSLSNMAAVLIHGDLHPANILVNEGKLFGVISLSRQHRGRLMPPFGSGVEAVEAGGSFVVVSFGFVEYFEAVDFVEFLAGEAFVEVDEVLAFFGPSSPVGFCWFVLFDDG